MFQSYLHLGFANTLIKINKSMDMYDSIFTAEGNCPVQKTLKIYFNCWKMSFFSAIEVFRGMLFGPDGLCESSKSIKGDLLVGVKGKIFAFVLDR